MTNSSANVAPEKYLFDSEFDYSETLDDIQSITPKQYQTDLEAAKAQAYKDGYTTGVTETNQDIARVAADQLFVMTAKIDELIETEARIIDTFHTQVAQLAELIMRKIIPILADQGAIKEVHGLLDRIKQDLPTDHKVTLLIHPDFVEEVEKHIALQKEKGDFPESVEIKGDPDFQKTDCCATWDGAGIQHYRDTTMMHIQEFLMRIATTPLEFKVPEDTEEDLSDESHTGSREKDPTVEQPEEAGQDE